MSGRSRQHHGGCSRDLPVGVEPLAPIPPRALQGNPGKHLARGSWDQPARMWADWSESRYPVNFLLEKMPRQLFLTRCRAAEGAMAGPARSQVDEPVHAAHHHGAANDVADGCRQEVIHKEITPREDCSAVF